MASSVKDEINKIKHYIANQGFQYPGSLIENFYLSLKSKPFVILAGISGTGKTKLVRLFAEALGATAENGQFTLIPVRPDWNDPSDLLGYKDISGVFRTGPFTNVLREASQPQNRHKPYFICLDEMNLARVEHYFSDILSIIETQRWSGDEIVTDPILELEESLIPERLIIPENLYIIGTVNMDETTHPFSKKVLDRANTLEFNYIRLEEYPTISASELILSDNIENQFLRSDYLQLKDAFTEHELIIKETTEKLVRINTILEDIHSHVGFRIRDAVCFYMIYNQRFSLLNEEEAFDYQLLQKILPRIQGSSRSVKRVLIELLSFCTGNEFRVNDYLDDSSELFETWQGNNGTAEAKYPLSARKLAYMLRRLEEDGFTSFWLS